MKTAGGLLVPSLVGFLSYGCLWNDVCVNGAVRDDTGACVRLDGGIDASLPMDANADGPPTDGGTDAAAADASDAGRPCALGCDTPTPFCHPTLDVCVECLTSANCPEPAESRCDIASGACIGCMNDTDCNRFSATPVCDEPSQRCVQCTPDTEADQCGSFSCATLGLTCTTTGRGTLTACETCTSDSECSSEGTYPLHCVATSFRGVPQGWHCLLLVPDAAPCTDPLMFLTRVARMGTSIGGVTGTYCFPREDLTTCEAAIDAVARTSCTAATVRSDCGDPDLDDALCRDDGRGPRCTYQCAELQDCPTGCNFDASPPSCCTGAGPPMCDGFT